MLLTRRDLEPPWGTSGALASKVHQTVAMVQLLLRIRTLPGNEQAITDALRSLMVPVQLNRGCAGCHLYVDADDLQSLCYVEDWATVEDLDREIRSDRFTRMLSVMENAPELPVLEFRFLSHTRDLDYIKEVREVSSFHSRPASLSNTGEEI